MLSNKLLRMLALLLTASLFAAACGDDDDDATTDSSSEPSGDEASDMADDEASDMADDEASDMADDEASDMADEECDGLTDVTAATVNPNDLLNYAINEGLFAEQCLNVNLAEGLNGPGIVSGLAAGEIDFGFVAGVPVSTAVTNAGQPIQIVSVRAAITAPENDILVLLANNDSGVASPADFEGKTIGIRSPGSLCTVVIKQAMINVGIEDPDSAATFIQGESNGDLAEQVRSGAVDVTCLTYPFAGSVVNDVTLVGSTLDAFPDGIPTGVTATSDAFAAESADLIEAWNVALSAAADFANEDEARWRALLPEITTMTPEQAESSILPINLGGQPVEDWDFSPIWAAVEALGLTEGPVDVEGVFG